MLKYLILPVFLIGLFSNIGVGQNKIKWLTWQEAIEKSKKEKKKIFIDVYTDWCGWCKKLDKTTFAEENIAKYINTNYYPVKFNAEYESAIVLKGVEYKFVNTNGNRGYHELAAQLLQGMMSYPTLVFMDEDFNLIQAIPGFQDTQTFEMIATYFGSNSHRTTPWNKYMQNFDRYSYFNMPAAKRN
jgi:thioredoxin-related protein